MNLDSQPYEILLLIFGYLKDKDIYIISQLNSYYYDIANELAKDILTKRNIRITNKKNTNYARLLPVSIDKSNLLISYIHDDHVVLRHLIRNHIKPDINHIWKYIIKYNSVKIMEHFIETRVFSKQIISHHVGQQYSNLADCSIQLFDVIDTMMNVNYSYLLTFCISSNNQQLAEHISTKICNDNMIYGLTHIIKLLYEKQYYNGIINICSRKENYRSCVIVISTLLIDDCIDIVNLIVSNVDINNLDIIRHKIDIKVVRFFIDKKDVILKYMITERHYANYDIYELVLDSGNELITEKVILDIVINTDDKLFKLLITKGYDVRFNDDEIFNGLMTNGNRHDLCMFMIESNIGLSSNSIKPYVIRNIIDKADLKGIDILFKLGVIIDYV